MPRQLRERWTSRLASWFVLENHGIGVLKSYNPQENYTILESYNKQHAPIIIDKDNPAILQGVYLGKSEPGPRFRTSK